MEALDGPMQSYSVSNFPYFLDTEFTVSDRPLENNLVAVLVMHMRPRT